VRSLALLVLLAVPLVAFGGCSNDGGGGDADADAGLPPWVPADVAQYVNPLIGTTNGETWPGADVPFGMVQWSPETTAGNQTRAPAPGGYAYVNTKVRGFSLTHMSGTGCAGGYGDIPFFPFPGDVTTSPSADATDSIYASTFSHGNEHATPGYYDVTLDSGARAELTVTTRSGSGRFTYPGGKPETMLFRTSSSEVGSEDASVTIDAATQTVAGWVKSGNFCGYIYGTAGNVDRRSYYTLYFHAEFDHAFSSFGTWQDATVNAGQTSGGGGTTYGADGYPPAGKGSGGWVTFAADGQPVNVRVGISFVSEANAKANLDAENPPGTAFDDVRQKAYAAWNEKLDRIDVSGGTPDQLTVFYTALYHALMHPNVFSDVTGDYAGMANQATEQLSPGQNAEYANFSLWDVYRGQLQLVTLIDPSIGSDMAQSLLDQATRNGGVWDRWTHASGATHVMTGDPGHIAVPTIYAFGGTAFDAQGALGSMVHAATTVTAADDSSNGWNVMVIGERPSLDQYLALHYVPSDGHAWGGAGETLEDVSADFAIAQLAGRLGDVADHDAFLARSGYWKNVFNQGYIQDRTAAGAWVGPFTPDTQQGFAEATSAQYTWMIPFDPQGLFDAMGGTAAAQTRLDDFFRPGGKWTLTNAGGTHAEMNNEPSIATPYLYDFAGQPWKTQETVHEVVSTLWKNLPSGIPGQDDLGAMSAWLVWSAMGLYPQYPGRAELLLTTPMFPGVTVRRTNGVTIAVTAPGADSGATYVDSLSVDGAPSTKAWLPESFALQGGTLDYVLATQANTTWGTDPGDTPPSFPAP
jgi:predicted alpha-1,2-mannosidase